MSINRAGTKVHLTQGIPLQDSVVDSDTIQPQDEDSVHGPSLSCLKPWWAELKQAGQATGSD